MKTKLMKSLLALACLLSSIGASAYDFTVDGIYYKVTSFTDMTCSVTSGDVKYERDITIPGNVTYNNRTLAVTSIGDYAFKNCSGLTSITIPNSVTSIGYAAFYECSGLTSITIPNSVTSIGGSAFYGCSGLTSINIPNSVTSIGREAFYGCSGLTSINIPNSVTSIGIEAFHGCSGLTSINIPNSVTWIGIEAFHGCSGLTSINIPNSVTWIGGGAFWGCSGLTSITIPNSVTSIENDAFRGCFRLTSITIPNSVTSIGIEAFRGCSGLMSINIPNSVTSIGIEAFYGCSGLTSINIPNSVTWIEKTTFDGCINIKSLIINDGEQILELGSNTSLLSSCPLEYVYIGRELKGNYSQDNPFSHRMESITEIAFGKYITDIPAYDYGINKFSKLETITLYNPTPPHVSASDYFTNAQYMNMNVYVPKGSLEAYQQAKVWKNFWNLQEKDLTGIETVVTDGSNTDNAIYDMQGRRLDVPKAGLNIINGKKVMIRK